MMDNDSNKQGSWDDPELEARIDAELEPLMKAVEEKAKELGLHGMFVAQVGGMRITNNDDGTIDSGYRGISRGVNMKPFQKLVDAVKNGEITAPKTDEEARAFFERDDVPGPTMMLVNLIAHGKVNAEATLAANMASKALSQAMEGGDFDPSMLAEMIGKALGVAVMGPGMGRRKEKASRAWDLVEDEDGNVIGFRDPETGEEDMLN